MKSYMKGRELNDSSEDSSKFLHENLWKVFATINQWIVVADTKAAVVIATLGVIAGIALKSTIADGGFFATNCLVRFLLICSMVSGLVAMVFAWLCLTPNLGGKTRNADSAIFFGDIAKLSCSSEEYGDRACEVFSGPEIARKQLCDQIWINSRIAAQKFEYVNCAISLLIITILLGIVAAIISIGG